jgi:hypothetical protein
LHGRLCNAKNKDIFALFNYKHQKLQTLFITNFCTAVKTIKNIELNSVGIKSLDKKAGRRR